MKPSIQCDQCNSWQTVTNKDAMATLGIALILLPPVAIALCAITIVGILFIPIIAALWIPSFIAGVLCIAIAPRMKGWYCKTCKKRTTG